MSELEKLDLTNAWVEFKDPYINTWQMEHEGELPSFPEQNKLVLVLPYNSPALAPRVAMYSEEKSLYHEGMRGFHMGTTEFARIAGWRYIEKPPFTED